MRRLTGNWGIHAKMEEIEVDLKELLQKNLSRPLRMLFTEPIILLISLYCAFIYGILYLFLIAYPIVFQQGYGMRSGVASLPLLGIMFGEFIGCAIVISMEPYYGRQVKRNGGRPVPEARLPAMIIGAAAFPIGLILVCVGRKLS